MSALDGDATDAEVREEEAPSLEQSLRSFGDAHSPSWPLHAAMRRLADHAGLIERERDRFEGHLIAAVDMNRMLIDQIERVRALADMWASEVSSDEQDYITAAKYRAVARDIYKALEEN